ncbi:MAG: glutamate--tRNA ligase, partial [Acidimicrobiia bacterium]
GGGGGDRGAVESGGAPVTPRLRMAPSPTGSLHVGNARTAIFNWLYARRTGGAFILRIDDTDRDRSSIESERSILEDLRWLGVDWDEGVEVGGPYGSYRQSDRIQHYRDVARRLVAEGNAYRCFCTPEALKARREQAQAEGRAPGYDGRCRDLAPDEAERRRSAGEEAAVRFAMPRPGETIFTDLVRGEVRFDHAVLDDFVLLRSDGSPTYQLASTVDDVDYGITHVVRGEDLLPSTPRQIPLTVAVGGEPPTYAHLPLMFGPDGQRLGKRHGATAVQAYRDGGYLPEAVFNYLCLLGWSPGPDLTIFSPQEAVAAFGLGAVSKNPAVFDPAKLEWMNGEYLRSMADFAVRARPFLVRGLGRALDEEEWARFKMVAPLVQERVKVLTEVAELVRFLFVEELAYHQASWEKVMGEGAGAILDEAARRLEGADPWDHPAIEKSLRTMLDHLGLGARQGLQPIRVAVTGSSVSPPLFESLAALGRDRTLQRLESASGRL